MSFLTPKKTISACLLALMFPAIVTPTNLYAQQKLNLPSLGDPSSEEFSPVLERKVGESIMASLRANREIEDDAETVEYLNQLAAQLATQAAEGYTFELFLVKDQTLNAFALPGGFIGVHTGLIQSAQTESELASVIGHEMGHVTQRHIARMLGQDKRSSILTLGALVLAILAARSSPNSAAALASVGPAAQIQSQLGFSRDAEREADRVGIQILEQSGFDTQDMANFFGRLQHASRFYENNAPAYLRTHPVTIERMADMQNRQRNMPYKQRLDNVDFYLIKARLKALANLSVDGLRQTRLSFEQQIKQKTSQNMAATWYGYTVTLVEQRDWSAAERALQETKTALKALRRDPSHPFLSILSTEIKLRTNDPASALLITTAAIKMFPTSRALMYEHIRTLQANGQHTQALQLLNKERETYKRDARLYSLSAESYAALNQRTAQHQMTGEYYLLIGALPAALEQFQLARQARDGDFYLNSIVDARFRELQQRLQDEKNQAR